MTKHDCKNCGHSGTCPLEPIIQYFSTCTDVEAENERLDKIIKKLLHPNSVWMHQLTSHYNDEQSDTKGLFALILLTGYIMGKGVEIPESLTIHGDILAKLSYLDQANPTLN